MWALDTITLPVEALIYVVNVAVVGSVVCGLTLVSVRLCRRCAVPLQYDILASGLILTLLCPAAAWFGQRHGPGLIEVPFSGRATSARELVTEQSMPVSGLHQDDPHRVEYAGARPIVPDPPQESMLPAGSRFTEPLSTADSPSAAVQSGQQCLPAMEPGEKRSGAGRIAAVDLTDDRRLSPASWQVAGTAAAYAWFLGVVFGTCRLACGCRSVVKLRRTLQPVLDVRVAGAAREAAGALRLRKPPPVMVSARVPVPVSLGVVRPVVVLPKDMARGLENPQLTAVLLHEMAHIARRDHLTGLLQRFAVILFWWNPLLHGMSRRVSELREEICDNHVLHVQDDGATLAGVLIDMADRAAVGPALLVAAGMDGSELQGLGKRISRLMNKELDVAIRTNRAGSLLIFFCGVAALLGIVCAGSLHAFQEEAGETVQAQEKEKGDGRDEAASFGFFGAFDEFGKPVQKVTTARPSGENRDKKADVGADAPAANPSAEERRAGIRVGLQEWMKPDLPPDLPPSERRVRKRPSATAELKAAYQCDFRGGNFDRGTLMPFGFDTLYGLQLLKPEPRGLRVAIPHHQGREKPIVGVLPLFTVRGDFEITADCELLATEPPEGDAVAGANLYILAQKTLNGAVLRRGVRSSGEQVYFVFYTIRDDGGRLRRKSSYFPADERTARLRLARKGSVLEFLVAEGDGEEFRKLHEIEFGDEDLGLVRLETTTERSPITVEVLWKEVAIRAEQLELANIPWFRLNVLDTQVREGPYRPSPAPPRTYVEPAEQPGGWPGIRVFDPFEEQLTLGWKPLRPDPTHVSLSKNPGKLTITTQSGGMYGGVGPSVKNLYLIHNPMGGDGDFVLTTCIESFEPTTKWQQAGLIVYNDEDNYVKCDIEAGEAGARLVFIREADGEPKSEIDQEGVGAEKIWIRIIKRGKTYERAYSLDGREFVSAGERDWGDGAPKWVGLVAKNGPSGAEEIDAVFDFFEARSLTPEEGAYKPLAVLDAAAADATDQATIRPDSSAKAPR